jgi:hypothetical protein
MSRPPFQVNHVGPVQLISYPRYELPLVGGYFQELARWLDFEQQPYQLRCRAPGENNEDRISVNEPNKWGGGTVTYNNPPLDHLVIHR